MDEIDGFVPDVSGSRVLWGILEAAPANRSSSPAVRRQPVLSCRCIFWLVGQPLQALASSVVLLVVNRRHGIFNLQACRPIRRPFIIFNTELLFCTVPSGEVPGGGAVDRALKIQRKSGGEGPSGDLNSRIGVLIVKVEDYFVFPCYFVILFVLCNPTADN